MPLNNGISMYLVYMDDSSGNSKHQVVGAAIIQDSEFRTAEGFLGYVIEQYVPEEIRDNFEFHASDLYQGNPPFDKIRREDALKILAHCAAMVARAPIPIVYGAVHTGKLRASVHATASPIDVAFRLCIPEIERWFIEKADGEIGIIIADDTSNQTHKKQIQAAFRAHRSKIRVKTSTNEKGDLMILDESRGQLQHIHDDMYFGNSGQSIGIQVADVCCWTILRHLEGKEDTEFLYQKIEKSIFSAKVEPS